MEKKKNPPPGIILGMNPQKITSDPSILDNRMMKDMEVKCPKCGKKLEEHRWSDREGYILKCVGAYQSVCDYIKKYA